MRQAVPTESLALHSTVPFNFTHLRPTWHENPDESKTIRAFFLPAGSSRCKDTAHRESYCRHNRSRSRHL